MNEAPRQEGDWDVVIEPRGRLVSIDLAGVWRYRDLVWMFFKRDFITFYKQTILGPLWYMIQPSLTALTYFAVFGKIASIPTDGLPPFVFYMSGIVLWGYFAACMTNNSEVFSKNAALFGKVYFPRLVVPISVLLSGLVALAIQLVLLTIVSVVFMAAGADVHLHARVLLVLPLLVVFVAALGMGVGLIVSAMTVRFRDLAFAAAFGTQLWMYATPVVYPYSQIPARFQWFFNLNPMSAPIETLRWAMFGTGGVGGALWLSNFLIVAALLVIGLVLFSRAESSAMDTV